MRINEVDVVRHLAKAGYAIIVAGGGGIPVITGPGALSAALDGHTGIRITA